MEPAKPVKPRFTHNVDLRPTQIRTEEALLHLIGYGTYKLGATYGSGPEALLGIVMTGASAARQLQLHGAIVDQISDLGLRHVPAAWSRRVFFRQSEATTLAALLERHGEENFAVCQWRGKDACQQIRSIETMEDVAAWYEQRGFRIHILT